MTELLHITLSFHFRLFNFVYPGFFFYFLSVRNIGKKVVVETIFLTTKRCNLMKSQKARYFILFKACIADTAISKLLCYSFNQYFRRINIGSA